MRQSIEKQRETMGGLSVVTVMFHDRRGVRAISESFLARERFAPSLSADLTDTSVVAAASSLPRTLNAWDLHELARHRTRRLAAPSTNKFFAEELMASSALAVSAVNPNKRDLAAVATTEITTMTEQRRCAAA